MVEKIYKYGDKIFVAPVKMTTPLGKVPYIPSAQTISTSSSFAVYADGTDGKPGTNLCTGCFKQCSPRPGAEQIQLNYVVTAELFLIITFFSK